MKNPTRTRLCALCAAAGIALAPALAQAAPVTGDISHLNPAHVDASHPVTLTVMKDPANFDADPGPVEGITFSAIRIDCCDLTGYAGWNELRNVDPDTAPTQGTEFTAVTDADGRAVFTDLEVGVWKVQEVSTDPDAPRTEPFLVTLPAAQPDGSDWDYQVEVHPKAVTPTPPSTAPSGEPGIIPIPVPIPIPGSPTPVPPSPAPPAPEAPQPSAPVKGLPKLPVTGASVGLVVIAGLLLIIGGIVLTRRRRT